MHIIIVISTVPTIYVIIGIVLAVVIIGGIIIIILIFFCLPYKRGKHNLSKLLILQDILRKMLSQCSAQDI